MPSKTSTKSKPERSKPVPLTSSSPNYNVQTLPDFERQAKRLRKKYPSLKQKLQDLVQTPKENPEIGTKRMQNCFKIRLAVASKSKGKSGEAGVITHAVVVRKDVYLLSIYDKSEKENLTDNELRELLKQISR